MRSRNKKERVWRIIITLQRVGYFVKVRSRITSYNAQYLSGGYMKGITCNGVFRILLSFHITRKIEYFCFNFHKTIISEFIQYFSPTISKEYLGSL